MRHRREYFVYIMANESGTLYTGVTNSIERRIAEHKEKRNPGFTKKYNINRLVYYESFTYVDQAIAREKQIKSWRRRKKLDLIVSMNPLWKDLAEEWYDDAVIGGEGSDPSLRSG